MPPLKTAHSNPLRPPRPAINRLVLAPWDAEFIPRLRRFLVEAWGDEYAAHLRAGGVKL